MKGYLYRHRTHVDRFFESADKAGLSLEFLAKDKEKTQDSLKGHDEDTSTIKYLF